MRNKSIAFRMAALAAAMGCASLACGAARAGGPALPNNDGADGVLRVCADPNNMPLSNDKGEGYENRIAAQMAHDFGYKLQYTYFPQRMGFVRHTLREKDEQTGAYKCDLIIGVPKTYGMTANTQPYLRSTYAMVFAKKPALANVNSPDDLLKLPPDVLHKLRFGIFTQTPAVDWLLAHGLIDQAESYQVQSGDPAAFPGEMIQHDLDKGNLDVVFVWGPIAGYFANKEGDKVKLIAFPAQPGPIRFDYEISMGVRHGEKDWQDKINSWVGANQGKIDSILTSYQVPLLKPIDVKEDTAAGGAQ